MGAMFVNGSDDISYLHKMLPTNFDLFGQVVLEKIFRNRPTRNKNCLLQPGLMDPDKMSNLYREPSYQVSVHLAKQFQSRFLEIGPTRNKVLIKKWKNSE
jgi:hypothetical protein